MPTETNKNQQTGAKLKLTPRQQKVIAEIVAGCTHTEACQKAHINRSTLYEWLMIPEFKAELERQQQQLVDEAFGILSKHVTKAVEVIADLLSSKDERTKRLAANDVLEHILKHKELAECRQRLEALERVVKQEKA